ncbi:hypothetical protein SSTU70S_04388 [Stutzerimonas stutzeri]
MQQISNHQLVAEWLRLLDGYPAEAAAALQAVANEKSQELAEHFYSQMLAEPHSASFLSHEQVKTRLGRSMQNWIITVCSSTAHGDLDAVVDLQRKVGDIHARIEIPVSLVLRGSRLLKGRLRQLLEQREFEEPVRRKAARMGADLIDLAVEIICFAYSQSHDRNSRAEEAYRLFSVSQNIGVEKERQRAALLDWENQLMFDLAIGNLTGALPQLAGSEFGLWFRHKASHAFQGSPESASILDYITRIDDELKAIATLGDPAGRLAKLHQRRSIRVCSTAAEQADNLKRREQTRAVIRNCSLPVEPPRRAVSTSLNHALNEPMGTRWRPVVQQGRCAWQQPRVATMLRLRARPRAALQRFARRNCARIRPRHSSVQRATFCRCSTHAVHDGHLNERLHQRPIKRIKPKHVGTRSADAV